MQLSRSLKPAHEVGKIEGALPQSRDTFQLQERLQDSSLRKQLEAS